MLFTLLGDDFVCSIDGKPQDTDLRQPDPDSGTGLVVTSALTQGEHFSTYNKACNHTVVTWEWTKQHFMCSPSVSEMFLLIGFISNSPL